MLTENLKFGTEFQLTDVESGEKHSGKIVDLTDEIYERNTFIFHGHGIPMEEERFYFEQKPGSLASVVVNSIDLQEDGKIILNTRSGIFKLDIIDD
jgi:hypothetical protein